MVMNMTNLSNTKNGNQTTDTTNKTNEPTQQTSNQTPGIIDTTILRVANQSDIYYPNPGYPHLHIGEDFVRYSGNGLGNDLERGHANKGQHVPMSYELYMIQTL